MNKQELIKEIEELKKKKGEVRGEKFRTHAHYIQGKEGVKGLKSLEKELQSLGISLEFNKVRSLDWYPAFMHPAILLVAQNLFNWSDKEIVEMGQSAAKVSFIGRVLIKYFVSLEKFVNEIAPEYWQKYYNFGELKVSSINKDEGFLVEIKDYVLHPIACTYNSGYFGVVTSYLTKRKTPPVIKETKCIHRGDSFHEFLIEWKENHDLSEMKEESQALILKLKDSQEKTKGAAIITTVAYIRKIKGENGVKIVEKEMALLGYPIKLDETDKNQWYPCLIDPLIMVISRSKFDWKKEDFFDAGYFAPQVSSVAKIFLRYFVSIDKAFTEAHNYWKKYYTFSELESVEINKKDSYIILRIKDFDLHPLLCTYHAGYFARIACFVLGENRKISVKETECLHRGDPYHEYKISWE
jgi:predicted hydrocarbon binding protein